MKNYYPVQFHGIGSYVDFPLRYNPTTQPFSGADCASEWATYREAKSAYDAQVAALSAAARECQAKIEERGNIAAQASAITNSNQACATATAEYNSAVASYDALYRQQQECNAQWSAYETAFAAWGAEKLAADAAQKKYNTDLANYQIALTQWNGLSRAWSVYNDAMASRRSAHDQAWKTTLASKYPNLLRFPIGASCNNQNLYCLTPYEKAVLEAKKPCMVIKGLGALGATETPTISDKCLAQLETLAAGSSGGTSTALRKIIAAAKASATTYANTQCANVTGAGRGNCMDAAYKTRYREILALAAAPGICDGIAPTLRFNDSYKQAATDCERLTYMPVCGTCPTKPGIPLGAPPVPPVPPSPFTKPAPVPPTCTKKPLTDLPKPQNPSCSPQPVPIIPDAPPCASSLPNPITAPVEPTCKEGAKQKQAGLMVGGLLLAALVVGGAVYLKSKGKAG